jgi:hypothetical protein
MGKGWHQGLLSYSKITLIFLTKKAYSMGYAFFVLGTLFYQIIARVVIGLKKMRNLPSLTSFCIYLCFLRGKLNPIGKPCFLQIFLFNHLINHQQGVYEKNSAIITPDCFCFFR